MIMIICCVCIILDITEIILFTRHNLQPLTYLVFQCVKTTIWSVIFVITVVQTTNQESMGVAWYDNGLQVILNGLVESVVLLYVQLAKLT